MLILQPRHGVCPRLRRAPRRSLIAASPSTYRTHFLRSSCPCWAVVRCPSPGACEQRPIRLAPHELRDELSPRREDLGTLGVGESRSGLGDGEGDASVGRHQPRARGPYACGRARGGRVRGRGRRLLALGARGVHGVVRCHAGELGHGLTWGLVSL